MLRTDRMALRRLGWGDVEHIVRLNSDAAVMRYLGNGHPMTRQRVITEEMPRLLAHNDRTDQLGYWAAEDFNGTFLGWFTMTPNPAVADTGELGYRLCSQVWHQGLATEGALRMIDVARAAGLRTVVATTMAVNTASRGVLTKAGLHFARTWHGNWDEPISGAEFGDVDYQLDLGPSQVTTNELTGPGCSPITVWIAHVPADTSGLVATA